MFLDNRKKHEVMLLDSPKPHHLFYVRAFGVLVCLTLFVLGLIGIPRIYFFFLTNWGTTLSLSYFVLSMLSYRWSFLCKPGCNLMQIAWNLESTISVCYWCINYPLSQNEEYMWYMVLVHIVPTVLLSLDLYYNKVKFTKTNVYWAFGIWFVYSFGVNLPVTLMVRQLYPLLTYKNVWSYVMVLIVNGVLFGLGYAGCSYKNSSLRKETTQVTFVQLDSIKLDDFIK